MAVATKDHPGQWQTYRTRFLIKAVRLEDPMSFTDALGRDHRGRRGDYLVESIEGVRSIVPRRVFEDVYVLFPCAEERAAKTGASPRRKVAAVQIHQQMVLLDGSQDEPVAARSRPLKKKVQKVGSPGARSARRAS